MSSRLEKMPTKLLFCVTVERSPGPVHVVMSPEGTVAELIREAAKAYAKEGRRPVLPVDHLQGFELHYSQYSLESLDQKEKVINLGHRNFFLCFRRTKATASSFGQ